MAAWSTGIRISRGNPCDGPTLGLRINTFFELKCCIKINAAARALWWSMRCVRYEVNDGCQRQSQVIDVQEHERALLSALVFADNERKDAYIKKLKIHRSAKIIREPGAVAWSFEQGLYLWHKSRWVSELNKWNRAPVTNTPRSFQVRWPARFLLNRVSYIVNNKENTTEQPRQHL